MPLLRWNIRRSADELAMASGTPWMSSGSTTRKPGGDTGTELDGKLSRLVLLSEAYQKGQDVVLLLLSPLLHMRHLVLLPRFMLLSPLLHWRHLVLLPQLMLLSLLLDLWHLVLLSLGQCHLVVLQMSLLAVGVGLWCSS